MADATLYQLADEYVKVRRLIDAQGGEIGGELEAQLDRIEQAIDIKVGNIQRLIQALRDDNKLIDERIAAFQAAKRSAEGTIRRLNAYCVREMQAMEMPVVNDGAWGTYALVQAAKLVLGKDIPEEYILGPGKPKIDRKGLREALIFGIPAGDSYLERPWTVRTYRSRSRHAGKGTSRSRSPATGA
jgi:hypothetical protein